MFKKLASGGVGILLLSVPFISSAQTTVSVQAQIDALLKQIAQLQAQLTVLQNSTAPGPNCKVTFKHDLSLGKSDANTGGEVSKLQEFLAAQGVYSQVKITGYFGPLTEAAVIKWKNKVGFASSDISSRGIVGPKTRAEIIKHCNQTPIITSFTGPTTIAINASGTWTVEVTDPENDALRYVVEWGDEGFAGDLAHPLNRTKEGFATEYPTNTLTHTYKKSGTYTVRVTVLDYDLSRGADKTMTVTVN